MNQLSKEWAPVEGNELPALEGMWAKTLQPVVEIPISSRCSLGTLSALDASFPGPESPLLGRKKCHFLLSLTPGFGLRLSVASGEVSGDCADLRRLSPPP